MDDSSSSTVSSFNIKTFIHCKRLPNVVAINSPCEILDVFIDADLYQYSPKGNLGYVFTYILMYNLLLLVSKFTTMYYNVLQFTTMYNLLLLVNFCSNLIKFEVVKFTVY